MRKRIGIITWCNNEWKTNYGQVLQAYALQKYLSGKSKVKVVNYRPETEKERRIVSRFFCRSFLGEEIRKAIVIEKRYSIRILKFYLFVRRHVKISRPCHTKKQVEKTVKGYDYLISGSDQIWSPYRFQEVRLWGIDSEAKRISYASSGIFEESEQLKPVYEKMGKYWDKYSDISVRENAGVEIIKKYTSQNSVHWVVDPVLLLEKTDWLRLCLKNRQREKYILCYFLGEIRGYLHIFRHLMEKSGINNLLFLEADDVECACPSFGTVLKGVGPKKFLTLIRNAEVVCTDSYHGTLFSLIFEREFYVFSRKGTAGEQFSSMERWRAIEEDWQLANRRVKNVAEMDDTPDRIDYTSIKKLMNRDIVTSKNYLRNALK